MKSKIKIPTIISILGMVFMFSLFAFSEDAQTSPTLSQTKKEITPRLFSQFKCTTYDGVVLFGQYMPPETPEKPTVILLHQLGMQLTSYQKILMDLKAAGFGVCLYDARGHGMSTKTKNGDSIFYTRFRSSGLDNEWNKMKSDLGEVIDFLKKEKGLKGNIKLVGASIGANTVLNYAADYRNIQTIVLLSPGLIYHDVSVKETAPKCAGKNVLLVASIGDSYSANSCKQIKEMILAEQSKQKISEKDNIKYIELPGSEHGTKMLNENLIKEIISFLEK